MFGKKNYRIFAGFNLTLGFSLSYISFLIIIPIAAIICKSQSMGFDHFWEAIKTPRVLASYRLSFGASFLAAIVNTFFGLIIAWVLVRYSFRGKKFIDALIDLPFALPTAISGIALTTLYAPNGLLGQPLSKLGIKVAFTPVGVFIAMIFIGIPFVVRTIQPLIEDFSPEFEEAAASLGANRLQTFILIIFPQLVPGLLTGFALAFARALGEYGSIIFIAGNIPMISEITPLMIMTKLEQYDTAGATALASVMLIISFILLLIINFLQHWTRHKMGGKNENPF